LNVRNTIIELTIKLHDTEENIYIFI